LRRLRARWGRGSPLGKPRARRSAQVWYGLDEQDRGRKDFFFEKKKQKTFDYYAPNMGRPRSIISKVFWFFF
jgi:hypothetical protein